CFINAITTISDKEREMYLAHDIPSAGHPSVKRTLTHLERNKKTWETMKTDVERYMAGCLQCQKGKLRTGKTPVELHPTPVPPGPWKHIGWDIVGPITESAGKDAILCITDLFMKAINLEGITRKNTPEGKPR